MTTYKYWVEAPPTLTGGQAYASTYTTRHSENRTDNTDGMYPPSASWFLSSQHTATENIEPTLTTFSSSEFTVTASARGAYTEKTTRTAGDGYYSEGGTAEGTHQFTEYRAIHSSSSTEDYNTDGYRVAETFREVTVRRDEATRVYEIISLYGPESVDKGGWDSAGNSHATAGWTDRVFPDGPENGSRWTSYAGLNTRNLPEWQGYHSGTAWNATFTVESYVEGEMVASTIGALPYTTEFVSHWLDSDGIVQGSTTATSYLGPDVADYPEDIKLRVSNSRVETYYNRLISANTRESYYTRPFSYDETTMTTVVDVSTVVATVTTLTRTVASFTEATTTGATSTTRVSTTVSGTYTDYTTADGVLASTATEVSTTATHGGDAVGLYAVTVYCIARSDAVRVPDGSGAYSFLSEGSYVVRGDTLGTADGGYRSVFSSADPTTVHSTITVSSRSPVVVEMFNGIGWDYVYASRAALPAAPGAIVPFPDSTELTLEAGTMMNSWWMAFMAASVSHTDTATCVASTPYGSTQIIPTRSETPVLLGSSDSSQWTNTTESGFDLCVTVKVTEVPTYSRSFDETTKHEALGSPTSSVGEEASHATYSVLGTWGSRYLSDTSRGTVYATDSVWLSSDYWVAVALVKPGRLVEGFQVAPGTTAGSNLTNLGAYPFSVAPTELYRTQYKGAYQVAFDTETHTVGTGGPGDYTTRHTSDTGYQVTYVASTQTTTATSPDGTRTITNSTTSTANDAEGIVGAGALYDWITPSRFYDPEGNNPPTYIGGFLSQETRTTETISFLVPVNSEVSNIALFYTSVNTVTGGTTTGLTQYAPFFDSTQSTSLTLHPDCRLALSFAPNATTRTRKTAALVSWSLDDTRFSRGYETLNLWTV